MRISNTIKWDNKKHTWFNLVQDKEIPVECNSCKFVFLLYDPRDFKPNKPIYCPNCKKELIYNEHEWW